MSRMLNYLRHVSMCKSSSILSKHSAHCDSRLLCSKTLNINGLDKVPCCRNSYSTIKHSKLKKFEKKLLPFELDIKVKQDILLYSYEGKEKLFLIVNCLGIFMFFVMTNSAYVIYSTMRDVNPVEDGGDFPWWHWWRRVNLGKTFIKSSLSGAIVLFGCMLLGFSFFYPSRLVRAITLLKDGERIMFSSYGYFGRVVNRELPLGKVSAQWGREDAVDTLPLKISGKRFRYLVNQNGTYHNRELFDQTVALHRGF